VAPDQDVGYFLLVYGPGPHRLDSLDFSSYYTRMSLRERTRPGLGIIEPCLPSPAKVPPSGPGWIYEIKHDGFRILARRDGAGVRLFTRHGHDFTARFPLAAGCTARPLVPDRRRNWRRLATSLAEMARALPVEWRSPAETEFLGGAQR
jgi:hypothetical protein